MGMDLTRDCVCAGVRRASRVLTAVYDRFLRPSGLKVTHFSLLMNIGRLERPTMTRLSRRMLMDKTTLTRNLRLLEKMGLVRLEAGPDRRTKLIALTPLGRESIDRARPLWAEAQNYMEAQLGPECLGGLMAGVERLARLARKQLGTARNHTGGSDAQNPG